MLAIIKKHRKKTVASQAKLEFDFSKKVDLLAYVWYNKEKT